MEATIENKLKQSTGKLITTLHLQEGVLYPIPFSKRNIFGKLRPFVLGFDALVLIMSLLFWENILSELSAFSMFMIVLLNMKCFLADVDDWGPSDMDLLLFEDHLEIHRDKIFRSKHHIRKEWECIFYEDIRECKYRKVTKQIELIGWVWSRCKEYDKFGNLQDHYSHDKITNSFAGFYVTYMDADTVIEELEKYLPIPIATRES